MADRRRCSLWSVLLPFVGWIELIPAEAQSLGVPIGSRAFVVEWLFWGCSLRVEPPPSAA